MISIFDDDFAEKFISAAFNDFIKSVGWESSENNNDDTKNDNNFTSLDTIETNLH